jgi:hypothetical protein
MTLPRVALILAGVLVILGAIALLIYGICSQFG